MKIAVIGGGVFGSTTSIKLSSEGFEVDLFERNSDLLQEASGINQYRLHRGYHYPRSVSTAISSRDAEASFLEEYGDAVITKNDHFYCIAKENSKVDGTQFIKFCEECDLDYERVDDFDLINNNQIELTVKVKESLFDHVKLRSIKKKIEQSGVNLFLNKSIKVSDLGDYDYIVNATYANINETLNRDSKDYQFELCEKPILELPMEFRHKSIVVLDGPFMCIDPYLDTDFHVMGNVVHAIHNRNIGHSPVTPNGFENLLNKDVINNPPITNIDKFIKNAIDYIPKIKEAKHIGSMFTFRTVLPNVDHTDERPTEVYFIDGRVINVFSGKIGNCVDASNRVLMLIKERESL